MNFDRLVNDYLGRAIVWLAFAGIFVLLAVFMMGCGNPIEPTHGPQPPLGPPLVVRGLGGGYYQNPLVTLPPGVTINPTTGAIVYPPDWTSHVR